MNFPEGQLVQLIDAMPEYFPKEHMSQYVLPCSENDPASQSRQTSTEDPVSELKRHDGLEMGTNCFEFVFTYLYFPASQEVQIEAPLGENLPNSQLIHEL